MSDESVQQWGEFAPPGETWLLRFLTAAGLGRGRLRTKILLTWKDKYGTTFDICRHGIKYRLDISDNITDEKILTSSKTYDKEELKALYKVCRQGVFVDIGANIGYYSLSLAIHAGANAIAIEPNPRALQRLRFNISANRLEESVTVIPFGVGPEGTTNLYVRTDLGSASLLDDLVPGESSPVRIEVLPLLDILERNNITRIDGMKIDIEGMEDQALVPFFNEASPQLFPRCIILERGHEKHWNTDLYQFLEEKGYAAGRITRGNTIFQLGA